jgi:hypothetical protein
MKVIPAVAAILLASFTAQTAMPAPHAQTSTMEQSTSTAPSTALTEALVAACRQNIEQFAEHLTNENAAAFRKLSANEQTAVMRRFSLLDDPGKPLLSGTAQGHTELRCEGGDTTTLFRFGAERVRDTLAFVPVDVANGRKIEFGLVRQDGAWRMLSLGLLLLDIPQLEERWAQEDMEAREKAAIQTLYALADAINTYRTGFEKLPESLAQLGPAPKNQVSPDAAHLVDADLAAGKKAGYLWRYRIRSSASGADSSFELAAVPAQYGVTGRRSFFLDANGNLHGADKEGALATSDDPIIRRAKPE